METCEFERETLEVGEKAGIPRKHLLPLVGCIYRWRRDKHIDIVREYENTKTSKLGDQGRSQYKRGRYLKSTPGPC